MELTYVKVIIVWAFCAIVFYGGNAFAQTIARNFSVEGILRFDKIYSILANVTSIVLFTTGMAMLFLEMNTWMGVASLIMGGAMFYGSISCLVLKFSWFLYFNQNDEDFNIEDYDNEET